MVHMQLFEVAATLQLLPQLRTTQTASISASPQPQISPPCWLVLSLNTPRLSSHPLLNNVYCYVPNPRRQQLTYQASAIAATTGVGALAILATYYKFVYHMGGSSDAAAAAFPWADMAGTLALVVGGVVGMEMWARWAHKALWHDFQPGWALHKSHHEPRIGPFEVGCCCCCVFLVV